MGNYYSLYSKNLGLSGKMVWWSTEPNWSTKLGDLTECLKLTLTQAHSGDHFCISMIPVIHRNNHTNKKMLKSSNFQLVSNLLGFFEIAMPIYVLKAKAKLMI